MHEALFVDGDWLPGDDGSIESIDPSTGESYDTISKASREQTKRAVGRAAAAAREWRTATPDERESTLFSIADALDTRRDEIGETLAREEGKPISAARGEVAYAAQIFRYYAGEARRITGETIPSSDPNMRTYTIRVPLGVIAVVTPWNFPVATPAWKIAPALAAGNAVVLQPSSTTAVTAKRFTEAIAAADLPDGVLTLAVGSGSTVGDVLATDDRIDGLTFTGSTAVGRRIAERTIEHDISVQAEMGGKNPHLVLPDADLDRAVEATVTGAFDATGQKCTATSRAIVHEDIYGKFIDQIVESAASLSVGHAFDDPDVGPVVSEAQLQTDLEYVEIAREEGATLLLGGSQINNLGTGFFIEPTVFGDVTPDMRIAREEIFGPVLAVVPCASFEEGLDIANDVEYGLSASVFTADNATARRFTERAEAGIINVNAPSTGAHIQVPFGGMKASSAETYKELGQRAYEFYTHEKAVYHVVD